MASWYKVHLFKVLNSGQDKIPVNQANAFDWMFLVSKQNHLTEIYRQMGHLGGRIDFIITFWAHASVPKGWDNDIYVVLG